MIGINNPNWAPAGWQADSGGVSLKVEDKLPILYSLPSSTINIAENWSLHLHLLHLLHHTEYSNLTFSWQKQNMKLTGDSVTKESNVYNKGLIQIQM